MLMLATRSARCALATVVALAAIVSRSSGNGKITAAHGVDAPGIPTITLNNGVELPLMSIGTGTLHSGDGSPGGALDVEAAARVVEMALAMGLVSIDTSYDYPSHERVGGIIEAKTFGH